MTIQEQTELANLCHFVNKACKTTQLDVEDDELIAAGWPGRIAEAAQPVLALFMRRGKLDEELEEPGFE